MFKGTQIIALVLIAMISVACGKKKSGGGTVATPPDNVTYSWGSDGKCYGSDQPTTIVDDSKCASNSGSSTYKYNSYGQCCDSKGNIVDPYYCAVNDMPNATVCSGNGYYYVGQYGDLWHVKCDGKTYQQGGNCGNYWLIKNGQWMFCK